MKHLSWKHWEDRYKKFGLWQLETSVENLKLVFLAGKKVSFTIPGQGQYQWITSPMGLLGCPASFQRLMEGVLRNISNVIVYIDDLLVHTQTHEDHLKILDQVLQWLHSNNLKINLDKCFFGNQEVSYLGFTLTPEGIKPGKNKLKAIKDAKPPTDVKTIRSFVGLCNFFRTHIKNLCHIFIFCIQTRSATLRWRSFKGNQPRNISK